MFNSPNKSVGVINGVPDFPADGNDYVFQGDNTWKVLPPPQGKNLIINGNLTVDQRGVYTEYVADRWKIVDANNMTQIIEDKNFEPSTEYTLSWEGGTPQQITSPASGHWTLPNIPRTARKIQLEKGDQATEFEYEPYQATYLKCCRYYYRMNSNKSYSKFTIPGWCNVAGNGYGLVGAGSAYPMLPLPTEMRGIPTINHSYPLTDFVLTPQGNVTGSIHPTFIGLEWNPERPLALTLEVRADSLSRHHFITLNQTGGTPVWIGADAEL